MLGIERKYQPEALPIELIAEIIAIAVNGGSIPREVSRFLAASSLVSRTWNALCRPYIFHTITISFERAHHKLYFLHFEAPHLSQHIHALELYLWPSHPCTAEEWFPECCGRLKNLRVLHFESRPSFDLSMAPAPLAAGISTMLSAPRLRKVVLRGWRFRGDASDVTNMLSPTLEGLIIQDSSTRSGEGEGSSTIRLDALRSLEMLNVSDRLLRFDNLIQCPNLHSFTVEWSPYQHWDLPIWLSDSLSELRLKAVPGCDIPNFGMVVKPSVMVIDLVTWSSFLDIFTWIKDCLNHLPFPNSIQTLTLNIERTYFDLLHTEELHPEASDYMVLSRSLRQLVEHGELKYINLDIKMDARKLSRSKDLHIDEGRGLAKLKTGFAGLLEANVLNINLILLQRSGNRVLETALARRR